MSIANTVGFLLGHPITRQRRLQSVQRFLRWQLGSRLLGRPVVCDWINGVRFIAGRGEFGLTGNIYAGLHEFADMAFVLHFLRDSDLFVDVGANVGSYSLLACGAVKARGIAFEPVPGTFERLVDNIRLNRLDDRVCCHRKAVGAKPGSIAFTLESNTMNHAVAPGEQDVKTVEVEVVDLDSALGGVAPALLKIDVEGFETPVVEGGPATLGNPALKAVIMELNGSGERYGFDEKRLLRMMLDHGFKAYGYEPFSRTLVASSDPLAGGHNTLFLRDLDHVAARVAGAPRFKVLHTEV